MDAFYEVFEEINRRINKFASENHLLVQYERNQRILRPMYSIMQEEEDSEVHIYNIPFESLEDDVLSYFLEIGPIHSSRMMLSASKLTNRGYFYVRYIYKADAERCMRILDGFKIAPGFIISVTKSLDNRRIFVGGVDEGKTKDEIMREFQNMGMRGIKQIILYRSYDNTKLNRGFAFVEFDTHTDAAIARSEFKSVVFFGRRVYIDWSAPIDEVDPKLMEKVKKLFMRNLPINMDRFQLAEIVKNIIGRTSYIAKVYKHMDYAFIHFTTKAEAHRALLLLQENYRGTNVEVTWAKPPLRSRVPGTLRQNVPININSSGSEFSTSGGSVNLLDNLLAIEETGGSPPQVNWPKNGSRNCNTFEMNDNQMEQFNVDQLSVLFEQGLTINEISKKLDKFNN